MSEHKIEREAVLWAWRILHDGDPESGDVDALITSVRSGVMARPQCAMSQAEYARLVRVAIAYVEAAKNHIDTVLELETNLAAVTAERDALKRAALGFLTRIRDCDNWRPKTALGFPEARALKALAGGT